MGHTACNTNKKYRLILFVLILFFGVLIFGFRLNDYTEEKIFFEQEEKNKDIITESDREVLEEISTSSPGVVEEENLNLEIENVSEEKLEVKEEEGKNSKILIEGVPFVAQAPFGEWDDPRQQDACEEVSALLAVYWARDLSLDKDLAKKEILKIADWEKETYGTYVDTATPDTVEQIFKNYFNFSTVEILYDFTIGDMIDSLASGNLLIAPTDGQALGNPNFSAPGPERHNLVIKGYDYETEEFITNDPGTRQGEDYRYHEDILFNAIRDYPTGDHEPISEEIKSLIVVRK